MANVSLTLLFVPTRTISLLPGATETIAALGAADRLVGISHECDWPAAIRHLPRVTTTPIDVAAPSAAIDAQVRRAVAEGKAVIGVDADPLREARPTHLVTQSLCEVCAVSDGEVFRLAAVHDPAPAVVTMTGRTLSGVFDDIHLLARALDIEERGKVLVDDLQARLAELTDRYRNPSPPGVVVIEWLEPCFLAGHWTPEIVAAAGGRDIAMHPGAHSVAREWNEITALDPDVVIIAICGFDERRARLELVALDRAEVHQWLGRRKVIVIDGNAYTSRAGPRLVEAVEVIGAAIVKA